MLRGIGEEEGKEKDQADLCDDRKQGNVEQKHQYELDTEYCDIQTEDIVDEKQDYGDICNDVPSQVMSSEVMPEVDSNLVIS